VNLVDAGSSLQLASVAARRRHEDALAGNGEGA
jgi:hypothetical protein